MIADSPSSLLALRARIAALHVRPCRMLHERVRQDGGAVLRVFRGEPEPVLVRVGLCSPEARARNLACGHTMARYVLLDALDALQTAGALPESTHARLRRAVESVSDSIHLLDHQKGEAEKRRALAAERKHLHTDGSTAEAAALATALAAAEAEVRRIEGEHDAYAAEVRELREVVLEHVDAAIARIGAHQR